MADHAAMSTVAIVEDHGALRVFLREALTAMGWTVTGIAGSVETGEELLLDTEPELAVVDLHLASEGGGRALIGRLADAGSDTRIVVFTATEDPAELGHIADAGGPRHRAQGGRPARAGRRPPGRPRGRALLQPVVVGAPARLNRPPRSSVGARVGIVTARCRSPKSSAAC